MNAEKMLRDAAGTFPTIGLAELLESAALQTRTDRKYFVPIQTFRSFAELMSGELVALEIDGRRLFDYESVYFDSPGLATYRAHLQRRRRRFKIRTRTYVDSGECMLEVKLEGQRGSTVKQRIPYPLDQRGHLTDHARHYVGDLLETAYGLAPPENLEAVLTTRYRRATLACRDEAARLTCDVGLACARPQALATAPACEATTGEGSQHLLRARGDHVLIESKAGTGGSVADRMLRQMGVRPVQISKYCVGVAGLHPELPSNPWHATLRRHFEWQPAPA